MADMKIFKILNNVEVLLKNNTTLASKKFLFRLAIFFVLSITITLAHPRLLRYFLNIKLVANEPLLLFILVPILILFSIGRWNKIKLLPNYRQRLFQTVFFLILAGVCYLFLFNKIPLYLKMDPVASYYLCIYFGHIFLFLAIFNWRFVKFFYRDFLVFLLAVLLFIIFEVVFTTYWQYFSWMILGGVKLLVNVIPGLKVNVSTLNIALKDFSVSVGSSCAGVYSLFAFTLLWMVSLYFFQQKYTMNWWRVFFAWLSGVFFVLIFNIVRIVTIVLVGAYWSKDLAINLFHEYLGGIFLLVIFYLYLHLIFPLLIKK